MKKTKIFVMTALVMAFMLVFSSVAFALPISNKLEANFTIAKVATVSTAAELTAALSDDNVVKIILGEGIYEGQFEITRDVTVVGAGANTVIKAPDSMDIKYSANNTSKKPIIYVNGTENAVLQNLVVDGAARGNTNHSFVGIAFNNAGGKVEDVIVRDITNNPFDGVQHGVGILAEKTDVQNHSVTITGCTVTGYQKGGIVIKGAGLTADITNNTVTGAGPTDVNCQNGIQVSYSAGGTVTGNIISGHKYTKNDEWYGGACGLLLWDAGSVTASGNTYTGNDSNYYNNEFENAIELTGTLEGTAFVDGTASVNAAQGDEIAMSITAEVRDNHPERINTGDVILDLGAGFDKATVKVGDTAVNGSDGKFILGTIAEGESTETFIVTITFTSDGTYEASIYVDDGQL